MIMNKENEQNIVKAVKQLTIRGQASGTDKAALVCDVIMLAVFLWNQIRYGMDMLFLIIPLALIGMIIVVFGIIPERYCFTETSLEIAHRFRKKLNIPYDAVFNYEAAGRDSFINITQHNMVKVYYTAGGKKRVSVCRPCDVETFVDALKNNCVEFHTERSSGLDVFFEN